MMAIQIPPAQARIVGLDEALHSTDRTQVVQAADREDIQQQLVKLGVDPAIAKERVSRMTDAELIQINGRLEQLPAGAGVSTVDLLLIIIIILLI